MPSPSTPRPLTPADVVGLLVTAVRARWRSLVLPSGPPSPPSAGTVRNARPRGRSAGGTDGIARGRSGAQGVWGRRSPPEGSSLNSAARCPPAGYRDRDGSRSRRAGLHVLPGRMHNRRSAAKTARIRWASVLLACGFTLGVLITPQRDRNSTATEMFVVQCWVLITPQRDRNNSLDNRRLPRTRGPHHPSEGSQPVFINDLREEFVSSSPLRGIATRIH